MKFHEVIPYAEKGYSISKDGGLTFLTLEEVKLLTLQKDELFEKVDWQVKLSSNYQAGDWVMLKSTNQIMFLQDYGQDFPFMAFSPYTGNVFYINDEMIKSKVTFAEVVVK